MINNTFITKAHKNGEITIYIKKKNLLFVLGTFVQ